MGLFDKTRRVTDFLRSFRAERKGGVALMTGFAFPLVFVAAGGALDYTNAMSDTQKAQRAMDAAVLALAQRDFTDMDIQGEGSTLFTSILTERGLKANPTEVQFNLSNSVISGTAIMEHKMYFLGIIGIDEMSGKVESAATPAVNTPLEIALVLDVSGSMSEDLNGAPRIERLKTAVNTMFDTLDETLPSKAKVSASVVPYSSSVNLGNFPQALATTSVTGQAKPAAGADVWAAERGTPNGAGYFVNDAPGTTSPVPFVTEVEMGTAAGYAAPTARLTALTDDIESVRTAVNAMTPEGWTAGHIGMAWGIYSLTESWKTIWPQDPEPAGEADKIIVLLSDGTFNTTHNIGNISLALDPDSTDAKGNQRPFKNNNQAESDAYFQNVCDLAKSKSITIYAVALALDPVSEAKMAACVGASGKLYTANSANDLSNAFKDIALRLGEHRLTS